MSDTTPPTLTENQKRLREHLVRCRQGGKTLKAYAAENGLSASALYSAKKLLTARGALERDAHREPRLVRVQPAPGAGAPSPCRVHLPNGCVFECGAELDAATVRRWLDVLRSIR